MPGGSHSDSAYPQQWHLHSPDIVQEFEPCNEWVLDNGQGHTITSFLVQGFFCQAAWPPAFGWTVALKGEESSPTIISLRRVPRLQPCTSKEQLEDRFSDRLSDSHVDAEATATAVERWTKRAG